MEMQMILGATVLLFLFCAVLLIICIVLVQKLFRLRERIDDLEQTIIDRLEGRTNFIFHSIAELERQVKLNEERHHRQSGTLGNHAGTLHIHQQLLNDIINQKQK